MKRIKKTHETKYYTHLILQLRNESGNKKARKLNSRWAEIDGNDFGGDEARVESATISELRALTRVETVAAIVTFV